MTSGCFLLSFPVMNGKRYVWGSIARSIKTASTRTSSPQCLSPNRFRLSTTRVRASGRSIFLVDTSFGVTAIEVKSGADYAKHKALDNLMGKYPNVVPLVLSEANLHNDGAIFYCPIYLAELIENGWWFALLPEGLSAWLDSLPLSTIIFSRGKLRWKRTGFLMSLSR